MIYYLIDLLSAYFAELSICVGVKLEFKVAVFEFENCIANLF